MRFLAACAMKDLRRRIGDPVSLILWLAIPLFVGGLMSLIFGGGNGAPPRARVLLVDEDASLMGRLLTGAAGGDQASFLDIEPVSRDDGQARMDAGEAAALVVIPAGFTEAVLNERPTTITLVRNPSQRILPGIVQTGAEMLVEALFYLQRAFAGPLRQMRAETATPEGFPPDRAVALLSASINERLRGASAWLFPPAIAIEFADGSGSAAASQMDFGALFLPSMLFMAVLFIAQGMADDLWREKEAGTLRRAAVLPHPLTTFFGGKLAAAAVIMAFVAIVVLVVLLWMGVASLPRVPAAVIWVVFAGTALHCIFLVLQLLASSRRGANILSNVVVFPMMMIGGAFFPFEAMPAWMRTVGEWTPNGQALVQFKSILAGTVKLADLAVATLAIGVPAAMLFLVSVRLAGGRFASRD
jgi:ABC-type multidrug transport system permease subunit